MACEKMNEDVAHNALNTQAGKKEAWPIIKGSKYGIGIWLIVDKMFRYLSIFLSVL